MLSNTSNGFLTRGIALFGRTTQPGKVILLSFLAAVTGLTTRKQMNFGQKATETIKMLVQQAPTSQLATILAMHISPHQTSDQAYCKYNSNGMFTCFSAWKKIRDQRPKDQFRVLIWHRIIPFNASLLLWRDLNGKLPTNEKLTNFSLEPSSCYCCRNRADQIPSTISSTMVHFLGRSGDILQIQQGWKLIIVK